MCGNGVRCCSRSSMEGLVEGDTVVLDTGAGEVIPTLDDGTRSPSTWARPLRPRESRGTRRRLHRGVTQRRRPQLHVHVRRWATRTRSSGRRGRSSRAAARDRPGDREPRGLPAQDQRRVRPGRGRARRRSACGSAAWGRRWRAAPARARRSSRARRSGRRAPSARATIELPGGSCSSAGDEDGHVYMTGPAAGGLPRRMLLPDELPWACDLVRHCQDPISADDRREDRQAHRQPAAVPVRRDRPQEGRRKTAQGIDVISLGIGDPDTPTPEHIVDAMCARRPRPRGTTSTPATPARRATARRAPSG